MSPTHLAAALLIVAMWGLELHGHPLRPRRVHAPWPSATWRFLLGALPVLFIPKPAISWATLAGIGGFMFSRPVHLPVLRHAGGPAARPHLRAGAAAGAAHRRCWPPSFLREHATRGQWLGLAVALVGVVLIARLGRRHGQPDRDRPRADVGTHLGGRQPLLPLGARRVDVRGDGMGEPAAADPAGASPASRSTGPRRSWRRCSRRPRRGWVVLFYTVVPVMWLGYLIWGTLLRTYPAAKVGPSLAAGALRRARDLRAS